MKYRDKVLPIYLEETREHIEMVSNLLVDLERNPGNEEYINDIFRRIHTLKGGAASVGFSTIGDLAHRFENILDDVRSSRVELSKEVFSILFETTDMLKQLLDAAVNGAQPEEIQELAEKLNGVVKEEDSPDAILEYRIVLAKSSAMKAPRVVVVIKTLQRYGEILSADPPEPMLLQGEFDESFMIQLKSSRCPEEIREAIAKIQDVEAVEVNNDAPKAKAKQEQNKQAAQSEGRRIYVRVDVMKLENMINLIGELVIERNRLAALIAELGTDSAKSQILGHISNQLGRITGELQNEIMSSRMVPISHVFGNLPRLARDTAKLLNKEIDLTISGEDTELDRTLVDRLRDPMVHLLRNSIDHGIEDPSTREKAGKSSAGKINISARHQDNHVVIEVSDDGQGINFLAVIKKVVEMGLMSAEELEVADQEELTSLVFLPGFSTASNISDVSGRGVGLDAVRSVIEQLNGTISVASVQGSGTRFTIRLPLTLAIIQALLFTVSGREFALPLANILETLSAHQFDTDMLHGSTVIKLRDRIIPLVDMAQFLGLPGDGQGKKYILVISNGDAEIGLQVDALLGKREIVIKPLGAFFANNRELAGVTLLGNGDIVPILDATGIFRLTGNQYGDKNINS